MGVSKCVSVCACCDRNSQGRGQSQAGDESVGSQGHVLGVGDSRRQWAGPQSPRAPAPWPITPGGPCGRWAAPQGQSALFLPPSRCLPASQRTPELLLPAQKWRPQVGFPGAAFTQQFPEALGSGPGSLARRFQGHKWTLTPRSLSSPVTGGTKEAMPPLGFLPLPYPHLPEASVRTPPTYPPMGPDLAPIP